MIHIRPELKYALTALAPHISTETLEIHSTKHHQTYVDNLNKLIIGTPHELEDLELLLKQLKELFLIMRLKYGITHFILKISHPQERPSSMEISNQLL